VTAHTCPGYWLEPPDVREAVDATTWWIGCEHPERPPDADLLVFEDCAACGIVTQACQGLGSYIEGLDHAGLLAEASRAAVGG
jgi:hypothetical protein